MSGMRLISCMHGNDLATCWSLYSFKSLGTGCTRFIGYHVAVIVTVNLCDLIGQEQIG